MEFTTAVKYGMNITHILLNNGELGKISKEQRGRMAGEWPVWVMERGSRASSGRGNPALRWWRLTARSL
jgi:hypothetical protein